MSTIIIMIIYARLEMGLVWCLVISFQEKGYSSISGASLRGEEQRDGSGLFVVWSLYLLAVYISPSKLHLAFR